MNVQRFIYRHRRVGQQAVALASRVLPQAASRRVRAMADRVVLGGGPACAGLPPIFAYWSRTWLAPQAGPLDVESPERFYLNRIREAAHDGSTVNVLSVGPGSGSLEIKLAMALRAEGVPLRMTCADVNPRLMRAGSDLARNCGVAECMRFVTLDCAHPFELPGHDVVIVNQFLHNVQTLETLVRSLAASMQPDGVLLGTDVIGRNGHLLWPDAAALVESIWEQLPEAKRMDRHFGRVQASYRPIDHAACANQGVRAQDVVEALSEVFDFELFFTYGGAIMPFVGHRLGFNFDPANPADTALIDRIHLLDAAALAEERYPASNMVAALRLKGRARSPRCLSVTPQRHLELVREQCAKIGRG